MIKMMMTITLHCQNLPKPTRGGKKKEPNNDNGRGALHRAEGSKKEGGSKLEVGGRGWGGGCKV
jgi:hypothetical protein